MNVKEMTKDEYRAAVYEFIRRHYRHDRFEGSPHRHDFPDMANTIIDSYLEDIERHGYGCISQFENSSGETIFFNSNLEIIPLEVWRASIKSDERESSN